MIDEIIKLIFHALGGAIITMSEVIDPNKYYTLVTI